VLQIERNLEEELDHATKGEKIPMPLRVRVRRDQVNATGAGIEAVAARYALALTADVAGLIDHRAEMEGHQGVKTFPASTNQPE